MLEDLEMEAVRIRYRRWGELDEYDETGSKRFQRAIIKMERQGLLERVTAPGNRRPTHVRLTDKGLKKADKCK